MKKIRCRFISLIMVIELLLGLFPLNIKAAEEVWTEISNLDELKSIAGNLSGNYRLTADIDLGGVEWTPIGPFAGKLDGNSRVIKNLTINNTSSSDKGLFSSVGTSGEIYDLGIEGANITAGSNAGILAGTNSGTIRRSYAKGSISGYEYVGGLVGKNSGTIENSFTQASVSGRDYFGGLAGSNAGTVSKSYGASSLSPSVFNNYLEFNGTSVGNYSAPNSGGYIDIAHKNDYVGEEFTLEAWFQWDDVGTNDVNFIMGKGFEQFEIHTGGEGVNGLRFIPIVHNNGDSWLDVENVIKPGWFHVVAVYDYDAVAKQASAQVYINGVAQDIWRGTGLNKTKLGKTATLYREFNTLGYDKINWANTSVTNNLIRRESNINIGRRTDGWFYFDGKIADVRFWNIARSGTDILRDKDRVLTGTETGLVGYWKLNETSGDAIDSSSIKNNGKLYGDITRTSETAATNKGGLIGTNTGTVSNSYYDSTVSGQNDTIGTPKTTAEMKNEDTFINLDFSKIWGMNSLINNGYPYLLNNIAYVSASGSDSNTGSGESPFVTINKAIERVSEGGTIYLLSSLTQSGVNFPTTTTNKTVTIRSDLSATTPYTVAYSGGNSIAGFFDIKNGNKMNLYNISIKGDKVADRRGIYVSGGSILNMYTGVTVSDFTAYSGAGVGVNGATFNMYGGTITGNIAIGNVNYINSGADGGGVQINNNGTFNMSGNANISNNESKNFLGGGVHVNSGTFNMRENAIIENNRSSYIYYYTGGQSPSGFGGGVCVGTNSGSTVAAWMNMTGNAIIRNNIASSYGGGVAVQNTGSLLIDGNASISNNTASRGGGISLSQNDRLSLVGSTSITGNNATAEGAGVYGNNYDFRISGSVVISNNLVNNNPQNIRTGTGNIIVNGNMAEGANINVYSGSVLKNGYSSDYIKYFHTDLTTYSFVESADNLKFNMELNKSQSAPTGLGAFAPTLFGGSDGKITGSTTAMEYKLVSASSYSAVTDISITGLAAGSYYVRYKAKPGYYAGTDATVTVAPGANLSQDAPIGLGVVSPTMYGLSDGKITGTTTAMEYKLSSATTYTAITEITITGLSAGIYNVRYKAKTGYNAGTAAEITVPDSTISSYKIEHYKQDVSGVGYTKVSSDTENKTGNIATTVTATPNTYTGFTENTTHASRVTSSAIAADGTMVLKLYYDRTKHSVTFNSNGGSDVTSIAGIRFDATITSPTIPTKTGYTFDKWYKDEALTNAWNFTSDKVTTNTTLYAKWTVEQYTLTYNAGENGSITGTSPQTVNYGGTGTEVEAVPSAGYSFVQWSDGLKNAKRTDSDVTSNVSVTAIFAINTYSVIWKNDDGTTLQNDTLNYGSTPTYTSITPTKAATAQYTYVFSGWSPEVSVVTGATTYTAIFTETVKQYSVTWKNGDGTTLQTDNLNYGTTPTYTGITPTQAATAQYTYVFSGWSPEISVVTGATTYTALFTQTLNTYSVTWNNYDASLIKTDNLAYGSTPTYTGDTPTKAATDQYTYTFSGWSPTVSAVTGSATYTAQFTETVKQYAITWNNYDASLIKTDNVAYGSTPTYTGDTPTMAATDQYTYTFSGWSPTVSVVAGATTYTALFTQTVNQYTLTFDSAGGTTVAAITQDYGTAVTKPTDPTKTGYTFAGWYKEEGLTNEWNFATDNVTTNITIYARWTPNTNTAYKVEHYKQDVTGSGYTIVNADTENKTGITETTATATAITYTGFTENTTHADRVTSGAILADGTLVLKLYYDRTLHSVTFNSNGGSDVISLTGVRYDAKISSPTTPTKTGYTFAGWYKEEGLTNEWNFATDNVTTNITMYARWTPNTNTAYKVEHYKQDVTGSGYTIVTSDTENKTGITETTATATAITYTGFTENTTHADRVTSGAILADGTLVLKLYYDRTFYSVTFNSNGGSDVTSLTGVRYDAKISSPTTPTKIGYTFAGWYKESGLTNEWNFTSDKVSANTTLYVKWTPNINTAYKVEHYQQDVTGSGYTIVTADTENKTGTTATTATATAITYTGFTENTTHADRVISGAILADGTLVLKLYYDRTTHSVTFNSNGGSEVTSLTGIKYDATTSKLTDPTKTGYTFDKWYKEDTFASAWDFANDTVTTNTTLYAQWTINQYTLTFDSASGTTVAAITQDYGTAVTKPTDPTKTGYTFADWYKEESLATAWNFTSDKVTTNTTLYAKWTLIPVSNDDDDDDYSNNQVIVLVNEKSENAATSSISNKDNQTVITVSVDHSKLEKQLEREGNKSVTTIPINYKADNYVAELTGQTVKSMEIKEAILQIKNDEVSYTIPAKEINIDDISAQIGKNVELKDIKVNVTISNPPQEQIKIVESIAIKNNFQVVAPPVDFGITISSNDKTVEVTKFNNYVERTVKIPENIDPSKITTGIVLNDDGTISHVPTSIIVIDGKYYAKINSLTNSVYSVIYSPKTFTDVAHHWANDSINNMASRLIINGVNENSFEPDRDITRAEFATIVVKALGLMRPGSGKETFDDVPKDAWYYDAVSIANEYKIITGVGNGKFEPDKKISREQAMVMIDRAMKITKLKKELSKDEIVGLIEKFKDNTLISEYAIEGVASNLKIGLVTGKGESTLAPADNITRSESAVIMQRLLQKSNLIDDKTKY